MTQLSVERPPSPYGTSRPRRLPVSRAEKAHAVLAGPDLADQSGGVTGKARPRGASLERYDFRFVVVGQQARELA